MAKVFEYSAYKAHYQTLWDTCQLLPQYEKQIKAQADLISKGRETYQSVAAGLHPEIPHITWWIIGVIHLLEANCDFNKYQHNGETLGQRTLRVPKDILFYCWKDSAVDASRSHLGSLDGTIMKCLAVLEGFNGYGYLLYHPDVNSPYLWSYTNQYTKGKYIEVIDSATGKYVSKWDPNLVSQQCGCAAIVKYMAQTEQIMI
jgi:lysozyme family protein